MIHLSSIPVENNAYRDDWKTLLTQSRMTTSELLKILHLENHPLASERAEQLFELRVPQPYLDKIEKGNPNDPLLLQVLPQKKEHLHVSGFTENPLNEDQYSPIKGLIHKYKNRVLLMSSSTCAINCRYCFRRSFPYQEHQQSKAQWQEALNYIRNSPQINEVILSGGDPLIQNNDYIFWLLKQVDAIEHIKRVRIHSRLATSLPQRIDQGFLKGIEGIHKDLILVTHCNHANELGPDIEKIAQQLTQRGVTLLNQSVLLRSVNDNAQTLTELSETLFKYGILPYYLFLLDPVAGAAHFEVPLKEAKQIYQQLLSNLPGYLTPKLSVEIPGNASKTPIGLY